MGLDGKKVISTVSRFVANRGRAWLTAVFHWILLNWGSFLSLSIDHDLKFERIKAEITTSDQIFR